MPNTYLRDFRTETGASSAVYPSHVQPLMQAILATLADIRVDEDHELRKLQNSPVTPTLKGELARKITEKSRQRQEPYEAALLTLQERIGPGGD